MLIDLHNQIAAIAPIDGVSQLEEGYRIDFRPEATPEQIAQAEEIAKKFVPTTDPKWETFLARFNFPGNPLYSGVAKKVALAGFLAQDHWQNFKLMLVSPQMRSPKALAAGIVHLADLLSEAEQPLETATREAWNQLVEESAFPDACKLPV